MYGLQDVVQSYFGMRKISLGHLQWETNPRIMLNNQFVFHMGVLDQVGLCLNSNRHAAHVATVNFRGGKESGGQLGRWRRDMNGKALDENMRRELWFSRLGQAFRVLGLVVT